MPEHVDVGPPYWIVQTETHWEVRWRGSEHAAATFHSSDLTDAEDRARATATELNRASGYFTDCSCAGRRWVDDENWSTLMRRPPHVRRPGDGLIPCGFCNFGGWELEEWSTE